LKIASFRKGETESFGIVTGDRIADCGAQAASLLDVLRKDALRALKPSGAEYPLHDVVLLPPVTQPEKIICVGVNYANRNAEYKDGSDLPKYPSIFVRFPGSLVGHGRPLMRPKESEQLDYEGEIAIVIGKGGRRIAEAEAESHIAGLTCCNEGTMRDWTRHGKFNVTQGKTWEASGSIGPWLVTADEFKGFDDVQVTTRVNGEQRQDDNTSNLMFPFRSLIRYISTFVPLEGGDVIVTGTPGGVGAARTPPEFMQPGDVAEIEITGVGTLRNVVKEG